MPFTKWCWFFVSKSDASARAHANIYCPISGSEPSSNLRMLSLWRTQINTLNTVMKTNVIVLSKTIMGAAKDALNAAREERFQITAITIQAIAIVAPKKMDIVNQTPKKQETALPPLKLSQIG